MGRLLRKRRLPGEHRLGQQWVGGGSSRRAAVRESWWGLGCQSFISSETKGEMPKEEEDDNDDSDTPTYHLTTP